MKQSKSCKGEKVDLAAWERKGFHSKTEFFGWLDFNGLISNTLTENLEEGSFNNRRKQETKTRDHLQPMNLFGNICL